MEHWKTAEILLIVFAATLVRSTFGFGEALIAVPLLALVLPITVAAPLAILLSVTVAAVVILQDWRHIHLRSAAWLLAPTLLGIPAGIFLLVDISQSLVKAVLAIVIALFSIYFLLAPRLPHLQADSRAWMLVCGFLAGILGGAYGMNGPPLVVYGSLRRWSPQHFRATLQGYFLPASLLALAGDWKAGLWSPGLTRLYIVALCAAVPAIVFGRVLNLRMKGDAFLKYVYAGLLVIAAVLLAQAIHSA